MVKSLREFEYFYCILEKIETLLKIIKAKVTDYAALTETTAQVDSLQMYSSFL